MFDLIVKTPFGGYDVGTRLTDRDLVAEILAGERETSVIKVAAAPVADPAPETAAVVEPEPEPESDPASETAPAKTPRGAKAVAA